MTRKKRRGCGRDFVQLFRFVKRSQAWHGLGLPARCALIELLHRYTGINNGIIRLGVRELAGELRCSHGTAVNAFRELDDSGLAYPQTGGRWRGKIATEWRIAFYRCDVTGDFPTLTWPARDAVSHESAKGQPRKRKHLLRSATKPQTPKNSIDWSAVRSTSKALLNSNQRDRELDGGNS